MHGRKNVGNSQGKGYMGSMEEWTKVDEWTQRLPGNRCTGHIPLFPALWSMLRSTPRKKKKMMIMIYFV